MFILQTPDLPHWYTSSGGGRDEEGEEIEVNDYGTVKKAKKQQSEAWLKNRHACHARRKRHEK